LDLLAKLKKENWVMKYATFDGVFLCCHGQKTIQICLKYCNVRTKKLHKMKVKKKKKILKILIKFLIS
jgi:hypothetical protein